MSNSDFNNVTLLLPAGSGLTQAAEEINGEWQKQFSLFFSLEEVEPEEFEKRLAEGNYTIALAPISAESGSVYNVLAQFTAQGGGLTATPTPFTPPSFPPAAPPRQRPVFPAGRL